MKKLTTLVLILVTGIIAAKGQCTCNYSYNGTTDTLTFTNLSVVSNAHYYWNFGDGSGSNSVSPTHIFPDNGKYLVTLYGLDTVSSCVDIYESWITVIKSDTITCNVLFSDTIIGTYLQTTNLSTNCSGVNTNCHVAGPAQNYCGSVGLGGWGSSLFLHGMQATTNDSINGYRILKEYYKTLPYQYTSAINYQNCSANFEVIIDYQIDGAMVTLTAMNKNATSYSFYLRGFGNPILLSGQSVSYLFPYVSYTRAKAWNIDLITDDNINSCSDTITQQILVKNPYYTFPISCAIYSQPQNQAAIIGSNTQFSISASANAYYKWQQDAGLGYVNLTNAGPYSGMHTDTLTISNVQLIMNNYNYRCVVYDSLGGCHNTSSSAVLSVPLGIFEIELMNIKIYPNPATDNLTLIFPNNISNTEIEIYNLLGEKEIYSKAAGQKTNIDITGLTAGVYFILVKSDSKINRQKFIKQQNNR